MLIYNLITKIYSKVHLQPPHLISEKMTTYYIITVASLLLFVPTSWAYSDGAPPGACFDMTPQHHGILAQEGNSSYIILASPSTQRPGYPIRVTLQATKNDELIKGFMVQARVGMTPVGVFRSLDGYSHTLDCGNGKKVRVN